MQSLLARLPARDPGNQYVFFCNEPPAAAHCRAEAVVVPWRNRLAWDYGAVPSLARRCRVDLAFFPRGAMPLGLPCPAVITVHDLAYFRPALRAYPLADTLYQRWALGRSIRAAQAVVCDSHFTRRDVLELFGVAPDKVHVVIQALPEDFQPIRDPDRLQAVRRRYGLDRPFVFFCGWVTPRKNLPRVLQALACIRDRVPHELVLTGAKAWGEWDLDRAVARLGLQDRVRRLGHVSTEVVRALYSLADATVFVSLYEGFGRPVLEAMTCGCPVLASNVTSVPEVAGDAALLVDPTDVEAIAQGLLRLLTDRALREKLIARGRRRCLDFSLDRMADQVIAVFQAVGRASRKRAGGGRQPLTGPAWIARTGPAAGDSRLPSTPTVAAVTVNYNRAADTLECVQALAGQTHRLSDIVVVDNGSTEDQFQHLRAGLRHAYHVRLVRSPVNLHFAQGYNLGIEHARASRPDCLLLINNDALAEPDLVRKLVAVLEAHPEVGVVGPRICRYDRPRMIESDGFSGWLSVVLPRPRGAGQRDAAPRPAAHPVAYVTGCCLLGRTAVLEAVGGFEPAFWSYYEDWDLSLRLQAAGYQTWHEPGARVWHKHARTAGHRSPAQYFLTSRNRVLLARRHLRPAKRWLLFWPATLAMNGGLWLKLCLEGRPAAARAVWQGVLWPFFGGSPPGRLPVSAPPRRAPAAHVVPD